MGSARPPPGSVSRTARGGGGEAELERRAGFISLFSSSEESAHAAECEPMSDLSEILEQTSHFHWKCQKTKDLPFASIPDTGAL